jgi:hypothetical protein
MSELLCDVEGGTLDATQITGVLDTLWDDRAGELTRVRMEDGSVRTIVSSELQCLETILVEVRTRELRSTSNPG